MDGLKEEKSWKAPAGVAGEKRQREKVERKIERASRRLREKLLEALVVMNQTNVSKVFIGYQAFNLLDEEYFLFLPNRN